MLAGIPAASVQGVAALGYPPQSPKVRTRCRGTSSNRVGPHHRAARLVSLRSLAGPQALIRVTRGPQG